MKEVLGVFDGVAVAQSTATGRSIISAIACISWSRRTAICTVTLRPRAGCPAMSGRRDECPICLR